MSDDARIIKGIGYTLAGTSESLQDIGFENAEIGRALRLRISVSGSDVYWRADGDDPEAASDGGHVIVDGSEVELPARPVNFTKLRFIGTADVFISLMTSNDDDEINFAIRAAASSTGGGEGGGGDASAAKQDAQTALLTSIEDEVDGLETLAGTTNTTLTAIDGHVDGIETLIGATNTKLDTLHADVDGVEALLSTIDGHVDTLETLNAVSKAAGASDATTQRVVAASDSPEVSALGSQTVAAATTTDTTSSSVIAQLKGIFAAIGLSGDAMVAVAATGSLKAILRRVTQGLEDLKTLVVLAAGTNIIGKVGIDQTTPGTTNATVARSKAGSPASYRSAVTAADVIAAPGTVTCTLLTGVGSAAAGTYTVFVVAGNVFGRTTATQGNTTVATTGANLGVRAAFAQVSGATFYDIYMSTDGAAAKFVGRITEIQRASGIIINSVNGTTAGGTANAVDIYVAGTGLAVNGGQLAVNTAVSVPTSPVDCTGFLYCDFDLSMARSGDIVAPSLVVAPYFLNSRTGVYKQGAIQTISFGGTSAAYSSLQQRYRVEVRGNSGVALAILAIAGTGMSVDMDATLS